ncbi:maleylpyruvate isomerase family mycothiol-dependent enzyme [Actinoplanes sp. NPDC051633]|uniref:maleylpyruvate isomerase family mycothiol-dependent enzyme n=1 Tax=Actinoplanes sp. NPDC051633 TaxID=3155670 RepID=UPI00341F1780
MIDGAAAAGNAEGRATLAVLRALGDDDWHRPTDCPEWDVRTMVSHLVAQCEDGISLPTLLRREVTARRRYRLLSGVDGHMAVQVTEHADDAGPDLVQRFADDWPRAVRARQRRPAALRRLPIDLGIPGLARTPLSYLLDVIYNRDLWMHRVDLTRATGQPFVIGEHDGQIVDLAIGDLARKWTGPPVTLELTGPAGGSWTLGTGSPVAVVSADAVGYMRALAGRDDAVELTLASGDRRALLLIRHARIPF